MDCIGGGTAECVQGAMEGGGGEVQGQGAGQKMHKSLLVCNDGADSIRRRRSLRNCMERARRRHRSHRSATGVWSVGLSVNSGPVS